MNDSNARIKYTGGNGVQVWRFAGGQTEYLNKDGEPVINSWNLDGEIHVGDYVYRDDDGDLQLQKGTSDVQGK